MKISYVNLGKDNESIKDELLEAIEKVLVSGRFILGEDTKKFEEAFAKLTGTKYAIGVNSGTDALFLAMKALGIGAGDEVIIPSNSFIASATSAELIGAIPVLADVKDNYLIDEEKIESLITKKTKAIMPVHLTGKPCSMDRIMQIAKKHSLHVIEDCAQAVLAKWNGKTVGSFGTGCFSLHPLKNLAACGDAGVITTSDDKIYSTLLQLRNIGLKNRNESDFIGFNSRLDTLQAAILNVKLKHLNGINEKRRHNAAAYRKLLQGTKEIHYIPHDDQSEFSVYHTFVIRAEKRDDLIKHLTDNGVESNIHYPIPIHMQKCFSHLNNALLPNVEQQAKMILSLPINQNVTKEEIEYICNLIRGFFSK